jgi:hypothetical protein
MRSLAQPKDNLPISLGPVCDRNEPRTCDSFYSDLRGRLCQHLAEKNVDIFRKIRKPFRCEPLKVQEACGNSFFKIIWIDSPFSQAAYFRRQYRRQNMVFNLSIKNSLGPSLELIPAPYNLQESF